MDRKHNSAHGICEVARSSVNEEGIKKNQKTSPADSKHLELNDQRFNGSIIMVVLENCDKSILK